MAIKTKTIDPIESALQVRTSRALIATDVRDLRRARHELRNRYAGGLPAEKQSRDALLKARRHAVRLTVLRGHGRRIDLRGLLNQSMPNGHPLWAIVDPRLPISRINGSYDSDGTIGIGNQWRTIHGVERTKRNFIAQGMPVLPARVREMIGNVDADRINWLGVLYQPDAWEEMKPDPALIVSYKDLPGEYYALAVWGGDRARIMEFVD